MALRNDFCTVWLHSGWPTLLHARHKRSTDARHACLPAGPAPPLPPRLPTCRPAFLPPSLPRSPADGKAGSLVDDQGHFYKPLQYGPRGDRERAFYQSMADQLAAEQQQQQVPRSGSGRQAQSAAGGQPSMLSSLRAVSVAAGTDSPTSPTARSLLYQQQQQAEQAQQQAQQQQQQQQANGMRVPWASRSLQALFPSFSERSLPACCSPLAEVVTQEDALGLLASMWLPEETGVGAAAAGLHAAGSASGQQRQLQRLAGGAAEPRAATDGYRQQRQEEEEEQQPGVADGAAADGASAPVPSGPAAGSDAGRRERLAEQWRQERAGQRLQQQQQGQGERGVQAADDVLFGRSPDSDEGMEMTTGEQLMGAFSAPHPEDAAEQQGQQHWQQEQQQQGQQQRLAPTKQLLPGDGGASKQQGHGKAREVEQGGTQPPSPHAVAVYSDPEQAQAAALLGQPAFDPELRPAAPTAAAPVRHCTVGSGPFAAAPLPGAVAAALGGWGARRRRQQQQQWG